MTDLEKQMRRALFGRRAQRQERCPTIHTVVVNCRPPCGTGLNIILEVPVNTISRYEAYLQAMREANLLHYLLPVVTEYRSHD